MAIDRPKTHAEKAIEIMNAWSATLQEHQGHNAPLQSSWVGSVFPRAAEIIRYTYRDWKPAEIERFGQMLRKAYLPYIEEGRPGFNGNWELSMIEAMTAIGVFLDDEHAVSKGAIDVAQASASILLSDRGRCAACAASAGQ